VELYVTSKMISIEGGQGYSGTLCSGLEITNSMKAQMWLRVKAEQVDSSWGDQGRASRLPPLLVVKILDVRTDHPLQPRG
jgi:hypothetical protein